LDPQDLQNRASGSLVVPHSHTGAVTGVAAGSAGSSNGCPSRFATSLSICSRYPPPASSCRINPTARRRRRPPISSKSAFDIFPDTYVLDVGGARQIVFGAVTIDPATRSVLRANRPVDLTARELAVLLALAKRPGVTLSRERLVEALYGWEGSIESNAIDVHIHHLRRKLGADVIETLRGLGWRLAVGGQ